MKREALLDRLRDFFARRSDPGLVAVYLFGSHAADRAHRESDVDVAVLLDPESYPSQSSRSDFGFALMLDLMSALHKNEIDVVVLNDAPLELARQVVTQGRRVICRDAQAVHEFVRDVQLMAADFDPFLRRVRRCLLETLLQ